ncbi:MAG TPA: deoxyribose-phosphate aldolase [Gemmatimonadaceae bacterium]|nr:deoxyribose-phosphate aldolase [Gemmatimonadaceae bacterium]
MPVPTVARIAALIDHTILKAEATRSDIEMVCAEAREFAFAAVCVNPVWVPLCHDLLSDAPSLVATVVAFPLGASETATKANETTLAVSEGADELDMVAAIGHIKSGDWSRVSRDIAAVVTSAAGRTVKVIIESAALTDDEIKRVSIIARDAGATFVKTSTGFHAAGGATLHAVALIRRAVGDATGVKASGGVRNCDAALRMLAAGATRIGTSSGVRIARCLTADPTPFAELVKHPERHTACATSRARSASA